MALTDSVVLGAMLVRELFGQIYLYRSGKAIPLPMYCHAVMLLVDISQRASVGGQFLLALNRFLAVMAPMRYRTTGKRFWTIAFITVGLASFPLIGICFYATRCFPILPDVWIYYIPPLNEAPGASATIKGGKSINPHGYNY